MPDGHAPEAVDAAAPPHSIDAEQALLGSLLYDNEIYYRVNDFLRPAHFYDPVHGRVYEQVAALIQRGDVADAITLQGFAERDPGVKALGGQSFLADLTVGRVSPKAAKDYGDFVYDLALRRDLIRTGGEIRTEAESYHDHTARDLVEAAERKLFSLAETGGATKSFVTFADALVQTIDVAAAAYERDGGLSGLASGLDDLDDKLGGLHPSDLIVLAGRPSMGKTALATNIAFNVAKRLRRERVDGETKTVDGGVVGFFSLEMSAEQLAMRLLAEHSGVASHRIRRGDIDAQEFEQIRDAANDIAACPLHIDDTGGIALAQLAARARRLKRTHGLDLLVIDYLQLITTDGSKGDNRVQEVTQITTGLKALAKELNVPVIALSQLSRQVEARDDKRPMLSDLRESGSIEQDADVVMFVYREAYYLGRQEPKPGTEAWDEWRQDMERAFGKAEVIIGKQRHGPIGTVELQFEENLTKFSNLVHDDHVPEQTHAAPSFAERVKPAPPAGGPSLARIPVDRLDGPRVEERDRVDTSGLGLFSDL